MSEYLPAQLAELLPRYVEAVESLRELVASHLSAGDPLTILDDEASLLELEEAIIEKRREATAPYYAAKNGIESAFRPAVKAIEELKEAVEDWIRLWSAESLQKYGSISITHPDVNARVVWDYEVADISAVPREFLVLNEKALKDHIDRFGDAVPVPGVRVFRSVKIVRRPKK